jgi:hypothetical protein
VPVVTIGGLFPFFNAAGRDVGGSARAAAFLLAVDEINNKSANTPNQP